jgi:hypothetical protein
MLPGHQRTGPSEEKEEALQKFLLFLSKISDPHDDERTDITV